MTHLPTRQIHLDFHTSPLIPDLLSEWDVDAFADTMKDAFVNSVTVFAKCHHGMSYYPTKVGQPHPALGGVDLLGEMIEALNQRDIHAPIYYTVGWEERLAYLRPEWRQLKVDGEYARKSVPRGFVDPDKWWFMSFLHPDYQDHMAAEVEELCAAYPVEGVFFDICLYHPEAGLQWRGKTHTAGARPSRLHARKSGALRRIRQRTVRRENDPAREVALPSSSLLLQFGTRF